MSIRRFFVLALALGLLTASPSFAQRQQSHFFNVARERAIVPYEAGMGHLRNEAFEAALKAFQEAIDLDPSFDMAYYMLGRTHMAIRNYVAASLALAKCRDLHLAESSRQFVNKQEQQRYRRERVNEVSGRISALRAGPQNFQVQEEIRQLEERKRQLEDADREITPEKAVPAYVSLALGSAYFRSGRMGEAEKAYLAAIAADQKVGEAHSNLAVVYLETGRYAEAERSVKAAEKVGFRVTPALKEEIKKRKASGS
jgi:tetratricopeptide (TPR) repeat protein